MSNENWTGDVVDGIELGDWLEDSTGYYGDGDFARFCDDRPWVEEGSSHWVCIECGTIVEACGTCPDCEKEIY